MNKMNLVILLLLVSGNVHADNKDMKKYIKAKQYQSRTYCLHIKDLSLKRVCLRDLRR